MVQRKPSLAFCCEHSRHAFITGLTQHQNFNMQNKNALINKLRYSVSGHGLVQSGDVLTEHSWDKDEAMLVNIMRDHPEVQMLQT